MAEKESKESKEIKTVEKNGKPSTVMIAIIVLLLLMFAVFTCGFIYTISLINKTAANAEVNNKDTLVEYTLEDITIYSLTDSIKANLLKTSVDSEEHMALLTVNIALNMGTTKEEKKAYEKMVALLYSNEVVIRDAVISILKNKTYAELEKPNSKEVVKDEILTTLQELFSTNVIVDVYFGEYYYQ